MPLGAGGAASRVRCNALHSPIPSTGVCLGQPRQQQNRRRIDRAAELVKPGGRLAYITCSVLPSENGEQIRAFLSRAPGFQLVAAADVIGSLADEASGFRAATAAT